MSFIISILANSLAILASAWLVKGVEFSGQLPALLIAGAILAAANAVLKPILKFISLPMIIITFGIFSFLISTAMLWITDQLMAELTINSFAALIFTTLIAGFFNILICSKKKFKF